MSNRVKLETAIEREVHNLVFKVSEHVYDFVNLYVRRHNIPIDYEQLKVILEIVKLGIEDGELKQIDFFHKGIKDSLEKEFDFSDTPFTSKPTPVMPTQASSQEEKITFTL